MEDVRGKRVLVVDDEDDIRKLLKRLLSNRGYRVLEADRGLQALRMVKEHTPDLIVLDRNLFDVPEEEIHRVKVLLTLLEGEPVFCDPSFASNISP